MMFKPLHRFALGVTALLPFAFYVWYVSAAFHLAPVTLMVGNLVQWLFPDALLWLKLDGHFLVVASNFGHDAAQAVISPPLAGGDVLGFQLNPLIYAYGLPLLCALILATPGEGKLLRLGLGILLIVPAEVFSMFFSVLKTLTFDVGEAFQRQQGMTQMMVDTVAMGYQIGVLLLPMIAPLIIWGVLHRGFILRLAPQLERAFAR